MEDETNPPGVRETVGIRRDDKGRKNQKRCQRPRHGQKEGWGNQITLRAAGRPCPVPAHRLPPPLKQLCSASLAWPLAPEPVLNVFLSI